MEKILRSNHLEFKLVEEKDALYTMELRRENDKYLSKSIYNLTTQKEWIRNYKIKEKKLIEFYFVIINKNTKSKCGTVRIYNIDYEKKEATFGSFILDKNRPDGACYEVISFFKDYLYEKLHLNKLFLDVRKNNEKAKYIYKKMGFKIFREDEENEYYFVLIDKK